MNSRPAKLCLILAGLALQAPLWADYQSGVQAYQQGDFIRALEEWRKVIESPPADVHPGERAETLYAVAMLFWLGQGIQQDTTTAAGFLRQAAELNHAGAQSKLGYLYLIGQGVPASHFEALKWLEMAARQGDVDAQYNLAVMYRDGLGVTADPVNALQWFEEAAANGDPVSKEVIAQYKRQGTLQSAAQPAHPASVSGQDAETDLPQPVAVENQPVTDADDSVALAAQPVADQPVTDAGPSETQTSAGQEKEDPSPVVPSLPADEPAESGISQGSDEAWILARDSTHYTIQVIALKNLQSMKQLIAAHPEMEPFAIYLQGDQNKPLHVLVQGDYATIDEARQAQQRFPASLAKPEQLWIRRFGMVQDLVRKQEAELNVSAGSAHDTH